MFDFKLKKKTLEDKINDVAIELLTKKIFKTLEQKTEERDKELDKKEIILNNKEKELLSIENSDTKNIAEITTHIKEIGENLEDARRRTTKQLDQYDIKAKELNSYKNALLWVIKKL